ncbi:flavodoxin family protein [Clostridium saccharobutylicum]|uniref:NADPH-dependent FMN reductase n=1 Tax=Clostridium saccharobutylicum DSM 13864 TaxID=1345695 RepID=U5MVM2_CLOSA|nr:flavodoxin family protein [Clostridium saccharobutylicum]AGX44583.1 NADPH-dependent FMN reductase [Clostridium saccharobutylicum DSM 13864]AQR91874.1 2-amino-4-deoxychorismate dehydrogenase [Clostridium saccharobutylicum]AQS01776.1 2-amino-4-deoxychorismate dehydrogenase [Clostridium saccharobutylicum]AQS11379.1 2-amino-4-deoxychorismate dehydrogenase [Clostridium saccharobutylicum]AQS15759.1 2-amino-4-deoxychorismate dehydrogenase [Clostridium saccharobutylicum]
MKVIAINGSPRKNKNTVTILNKALEGAASRGAETELIHLYDQNYKGCVSCFACKLKDGKSYGKCALKDDLTPILEKVSNADAIIFGSPIYLHSVTGAMRSFLERLIFQYLVYDKDHSSLFQRKIPAGFIYTMNVTNEQFKSEYENDLKSLQVYIEKTFGSFESLAVNDTYQFNDYSKYVSSLFDEKKKRKVKEEQFPKDCQNAFNMGVRFVEQANM